MRRIVLIDVTHAGALVFYLLNDSAVIEQKRYSGRHPDPLLSLEKFLNICRLGIKEVDVFVLLEGRGSFSGVRQAAAVLNVIHLINNKKVFGLDARKSLSFKDVVQAAVSGARGKHGILRPLYSGEPNITYPAGKS